MNRMETTDTNDDEQIIKDFKEAVNMSAGEVEKWLGTKESEAVGYKTSDDEESVGHQSGKRIVEILRKKQADYTDEDIKHIRKVTGYVHRHLAQKPGGDITATNWRYSLMNWGHDPAKKK